METETFQHEGLTVRIGLEQYDHEHANPRDMDQLGTMVCWHPDYVLGDEQISGARGAVETPFETANGRRDFASMEQIERYLRIARGAVVVMPLYLLDHSGISMSVGSNTVGRGDTASGGRDTWGNPNGWDTSMVGFIYTTAEQIEKLCGPPPRKGDEFYCPPDWDGDSRAWIVQQLRDEIHYYDAYLQGSVYWYSVEDTDGETVDSCGCYLVADESDMENIRDEARSAAEAHNRWEAEQVQAIDRAMAL